MDFFTIMDISHKSMDILNPSNPEKICKVGELMAFGPDSRVIDYGCGNGEPLILWAEKYGISGTGIDIGKQNTDKAIQKISDRELADRLQIICADGKGYIPDRTDYDAGTCIGATFIWDGYRSAVQAMKKAVVPGGKLAIGEVYWLKEGIPQEYFDEPGADIARFEHEILQISIEEGYDVEYIVRASLDDWDWYNTNRWHNTIRWIDENPEHPDRQEIINYLHVQQEKYLRYEREYLGWAVYILAPKTY